MRRMLWLSSLGLWLWLGVAAVGAASGGCKSGEKPGSTDEKAPAVAPPAGSGTVPAVSPATSTGAAAAAVAMPGLPDAEVRAVIARWLAAQNSGNFAAYQALYAEKMEGVKRVASRTWRYDRKGWLADRQRMFARPMKVEVSALTVSSLGPSATVELEQRFTQGKFSDRGPKRLIVVKEGNALRIAREEMLRSELEGGAVAAASGAVYLVGLVEGQRYVYLAQDGVSADWGTGPLEGPLGDEPMLALRDAGKAPAKLAAWRGREVKAYASDGTLCQARVESLSLLGGGTPHFGVVQAWNGDPSMSDDGRVYTPAERAESVFAMGGPYLVGELEVEGSCAPVVVLDSDKAPVFYAPHEPELAARDAALKAYRALPEYKALQKEWKSDWGGKGEWAKDAAVREYEGGGKRFVAVSTTIESCGEFSADLSVLFEERGGKLVRLALRDAPKLLPTALFDSDGDGQLEAVSPGAGFGSYETYLTTQDGELAPVKEVLFPFGDCGC